MKKLLILSFSLALLIIGIKVLAQNGPAGGGGGGGVADDNASNPKNDLAGVVEAGTSNSAPSPGPGNPAPNPNAKPTGKKDGGGGGGGNWFFGAGVAFSFPSPTHRCRTTPPPEVMAVLRAKIVALKKELEQFWGSIDPESPDYKTYDEQLNGIISAIKKEQAQLKALSQAYNTTEDAIQKKCLEQHTPGEQLPTVTPLVGGGAGGF